MREFGKIKMLLDTADIDEDEWDRTRGSCELLGGRLQQIRHGIISIVSSYVCLDCRMQPGVLRD